MFGRFANNLKLSYNRILPMRLRKEEIAADSSVAFNLLKRIANMPEIQHIFVHNATASFKI
jgi:hypothetical protein